MDSHFKTFSGVMELNCCVINSVSDRFLPVNCASFNAAPIRKQSLNVPLSVGSADAPTAISDANTATAMASLLCDLGLRDDFNCIDFRVLDLADEFNFENSICDLHGYSFNVSPVWSASLYP